MKKSILFLASILCGASMYAAMPPIKSVEVTSVSHNSNMLAPNVGDVVVLKSQPIGENAAIQVVKDSRGIVSKRIVKGSTAIRKTNAALKSTNSSLNESFEDWDGTTPNWLPDGWSEINSSAELAALNDGLFTWHVSSNTNERLLDAIDGKNYAEIYPAFTMTDDGETVGLPQDEWLLSPRFTPTADEKLCFSVGYSPIFLFNIDDEHFDWGSLTFINKIASNTLQIYIREGEGEWALIKDIFDDWKDLDFPTLFENYVNEEWFNYAFPLADYAGKEIQVAFRFVGKDGGVIILDAIGSAVPSTSASYKIPAGSYYWGISTNFDLASYTGSAEPSYKTIIQVPPFTAIKWEGIASANTESYAWNWTNAEGEEQTGDKQYFFNVYSPTENNNFATAPTFTTSAPYALSDSFTMDALISVGGKPSAEAVEYPLTNANVFEHVVTDLSYGEIGLFGYNSKSDEAWTNIEFGTSPTESQKAHLSGLAAYYECPIDATYLNAVSVQCIGAVASTDKLAIDIYPLDEAGEIDGDIVTGKFSKNFIVSDEDIVSNTLIFDVTDKDGKPFIFNQPIMVMFRGFDVEGNDFKMLQDLYYDGPSSAYYLIDYTYKDGTFQKLFPISVLTTSKGSIKGNFLINIYTEQPWLTCVGDRKAEISGSNLSASFYFDSYYSHDKLTFEVFDENGNDIDWLHYTIEETETNDFIIRATADPLPDGVESRNGYINIKDELVIDYVKITQTKSDSGVEEITIASPVKFIDGNIIVEGAQSDINVYNLAGAVVATAPAQEGSTIIDASSLGSGIYLVRIADKAYKIRK